MPDYDAALKLLFRQTASRAIQLIAGVTITRWPNIELPKAQNLRMDLLGEDPDQNLHHFELQSTNDPAINLRMAEYALGTYRLTGQFPRQMVLYVGAPHLTMPNELRGPSFLNSYQVIDIRDLDGQLLLASADVGDNILAILTRLRDHKEAIRTIVSKIAELPEGQRDAAVQQLVVLSGLRRLEETVREEVGKMPIIIDLMENEIIGPAIRRGLEQGLEQGQKQGLEQGEQRLLRLVIEKRFGPIPAWANDKLTTLTTAEMETLCQRIFDAPTLEALLN